MPEVREEESFEMKNEERGMKNKEGLRYKNT